MVVPLKWWNGSNIWEQPQRNQNSIQEEIKSSLEVRDCLLSFGAGSFSFQFATQKYKY